MKKRDNNPLLPRAAAWAGMAAAIAILGFLSVSLIKKSSYYTVRDVYVHEGRRAPIDLSYLKGRNIFTVDLQREAVYIAQRYPTYKTVRLVRVLPNRLYAEFVARTPRAYVQLSRVYCVDDDLVLFDVPLPAVPGGALPDLPVITGMASKIIGPKTGKQYPLKELWFAVNIVKEFKSLKGLNTLPLKRIEVPSGETATVFIPSLGVGTAAGKSPAPLEVKLACDDLNGKMRILDSLMTQLKDTRDTIKYIDLRFKEPVIKLNDVKK